MTEIDRELDDAARAKYDACETPKPDWDQLGETTREVWRGYVLAERFGEFA
jgi:hypothetical protein